jgi:hypothetical protein
MRTEANYRSITWPVVECSLWLRAGILSAGAAALALATVASTESAGLITLAWGIAAGVFGFYALRRAWSVLGEEERRLDAAEHAAPRAIAALPSDRAALLLR